MSDVLFPCVFPAPQVTQISIQTAPAALDGMRALFVSDVHLRRSVSDEKLEALARLIDAQHADVLLLGGDYGEGKKQCARFFDAIAPLRFPMGAFAVPGNNDDPAMLETCARKAGIRLLVNAATDADYHGCRIEIGGCDEYKYGDPQTDRLFSDSGAYRIFLSHFPVLPKCGCDLQFSGHTHGGQISLFGLSPYSIAFENKYDIAAARGDCVVHGTRLLISNGIGVSRLPVRIGAAPEILLAQFGS